MPVRVKQKYKLFINIFGYMAWLLNSDKISKCEIIREIMYFTILGIKYKINDIF